MSEEINIVADTEVRLVTHIPYNIEGKLGEEYNKLMEEANAEWVLFLDHDVLICNPHWYYICQRVIKENPDAGMFTCYASDIRCTHQMIKSPGVKSTIREHLDFAKELFLENKFNVTPISSASGFFMLIKKEAWKTVGGFPGKAFFTEDRKFSGRIHKSAYKLYRIDGLYVYHVYKDKPYFELKGSLLSEDFKRKK